MENRNVQFPNRYELVPVEGTKGLVDLRPVPGSIYEAGTPYSKETMLSDDTAALFGLGRDAVPDKVFSLIQKQLEEQKNYLKQKVYEAVGLYGGLVYDYENPDTTGKTLSVEGNVGSQATLTLDISFESFSDTARICRIDEINVLYQGTGSNAGSYKTSTEFYLNGSEKLNLDVEDVDSGGYPFFSNDGIKRALKSNLAAVVGRPLTNADTLSIVFRTLCTSSGDGPANISNVRIANYSVSYLNE